MPEDERDRDRMNNGEHQGYAERTEQFPESDVFPQRFIQFERPKNQYGKRRIEQNELTECVEVFRFYV